MKFRAPETLNLQKLEILSPNLENLVSSRNLLKDNFVHKFKNFGFESNSEK